ncbi:MAG: hypothetical protein AB1898_33235, partial [Acidobacteriota bacterium]
MRSGHDRLAFKALFNRKTGLLRRRSRFPLESSAGTPTACLGPTPFRHKLLSFLEERGLSYIVVARMTRWLKRQAAQVRQWAELDENYAV